MCYIANKLLHRKCVADIDIICYKVLEKAPGFWKTAYIGLHIEFFKKLPKVNVNPYVNKPGLVTIGEGYHCYNSMGAAHRDVLSWHKLYGGQDQYAAFEAIIPKGTTYYTDDYKIVSEVLIITDKLITN